MSLDTVILSMSPVWGPSSSMMVMTFGHPHFCCYSCPAKAGVRRHKTVPCRIGGGGCRLSFHSLNRGDLNGWRCHLASRVRAYVSFGKCMHIV